MIAFAPNASSIMRLKLIIQADNHLLFDVEEGFLRQAFDVLHLAAFSATEV
jgi:hypothetical protein